jgi:hypothetical protein
VAGAALSFIHVKTMPDVASPLTCNPVSAAGAPMLLPTVNVAPADQPLVPPVFVALTNHSVVEPLVNATGGVRHVPPEAQPSDVAS